jgi:hypothetical protein
MKNFIGVLLLVFFSISLQGYSQCNVQSSKGSNGAIFKYLSSEFVGNGTGFELGISFSTNGSNYFLNVNVKYAKKAVKLAGPLIVILKNNQSLNLKLSNSQISNGKNLELVMGVFSLTSSDTEKLKASPIDKIVFQEVGGKNQSVRLLKNFDIALRQLKCLE